MLGVLALAVHVDRQSAVTKPGQVTGTAFGVIVEAPPFMDDHDTRALAFDCVVIGVIADHLGAVGGGVGDFLSLNFSVSEGAHSHQGCTEQVISHGGLLVVVDVETIR